MSLQPQTAQLTEADGGYSKIPELAGERHNQVMFDEHLWPTRWVLRKMRLPDCLAELAREKLRGTVQNFFGASSKQTGAAAPLRLTKIFMISLQFRTAPLWIVGHFSRFLTIFCIFANLNKKEKKYFERKIEVENAFDGLWNEKLSSLPTNWTEEDVFNKKCEIWQYICKCLYDPKGCDLTRKRSGACKRAVQ